MRKADLRAQIRGNRACEWGADLSRLEEAKCLACHHHLSVKDCKLLVSL